MTYPLRGGFGPSSAVHRVPLALLARVLGPPRSTVTQGLVLADLLGRHKANDSGGGSCLEAQPAEIMMRSNAWSASGRQPRDPLVRLEDGRLLCGPPLAQPRAPPRHQGCGGPRSPRSALPSSPSPQALGLPAGRVLRSGRSSCPSSRPTVRADACSDGRARRLHPRIRLLGAPARRGPGSPVLGGSGIANPALPPHKEPSGVVAPEWCCGYSQQP